MHDFCVMESDEYFSYQILSVCNVFFFNFKPRFTCCFRYQALPDRAREEPRYVKTLPRSAHLNQNSQPSPKIPPRVPPKPTREKIQMVKEEKKRQENSYNAVRSDMRRRSNPEIPTRPPLPSQDYSGGMADERGSINRTMEVELSRDRETGYGFSIRGGRELDLPIFVLRMADGGAAQRDGRLRVSQMNNSG